MNLLQQLHNDLAGHRLRVGVHIVVYTMAALAVNYVLFAQAVTMTSLFVTLCVVLLLMVVAHLTK